MKTEIPKGKYLGTLCKRGHEWENSGGSLRLSSTRNCVYCMALRRKTKKYKELQYRSGVKLRRLNRDRYNGYARTHYHAHLEESRAKGRNRGRKEKAVRAVRYKKYYALNRESINCKNREQRKKASVGLDDSYIRQILCLRSKIKAEDIPRELIDLKRITLKIKRLLWEIQNG